ncbi:hypothetical protein [Ornithinimicrobium kibberense]|uniref:hypothetical protein n=1 Tax=Ornithinimicrobium kibberense TaxID=282060 RepID=UPI0036200E73
MTSSIEEAMLRSFPLPALALNELLLSRRTLLRPPVGDGPHDATPRSEAEECHARSTAARDGHLPAL